MQIKKDTLASLELPNLSISWDDYWETFNNQFYKFHILELKNARLLLPLDFNKIEMRQASRPSFDGEFELEIKEFIVDEGEILFYDMLNQKSGRINADYNLNSSKPLFFEKGEIPKNFQDVAKDIFLEFHNLTYFLKDDLHKVDYQKNYHLIYLSKTSKLISSHFRPIYTPRGFF